MQQGPKSRKSPLQMSFRNDYILENDTTAELKAGDSCLVYDTRQQLWTREAVVAEVRPSGRSYWLTEISTGRKLLRSRRHIRRRKGAAAADKAADKEQAKKVRVTEEGASRDPPSPCSSSPSPVENLHPLHALCRPHRCHLPLHGHRSESGSLWGQNVNSPIACSIFDASVASTAPKMKMRIYTHYISSSTRMSFPSTPVKSSTSVYHGRFAIMW